MKMILVLSPHTDDAELGMGGTIARFVDEGHDVRCVAFSNADRQQLEDEFMEATDRLGILPSKALCHNFPRRNFPTSRQAILQHMIAYKERLKPDLVFVPSIHDIHQDHQVVTAEAQRAFKLASILAYELPWNNPVFETRFFVPLDRAHIERKIDALLCYKSQEHRAYLSEDLVWALATLRGTQIEQPYAEAFEVIRWIL
jgi:N-acetylglucosamine malate deacetylase 1